MSILSNIVGRHTTAYGPLRASVVACLKAAGLKAGGTAGYPRVEVHSVLETERLDKAGSVRRLSLVVESISGGSLTESADMNETAMDALTAEGALSAGTSWRVFGVTPTQLQELTETTDSAKILYRTLQTYDILVERL